jgi:hypothetical protein
MSNEVNDREIVNYYLTKDGFVHLRGSSERQFLQHYAVPGYVLHEGIPPETAINVPADINKHELHDDDMPSLQKQLLLLWDDIHRNRLTKANSKFYDFLRPYTNLPEKPKRVSVPQLNLEDMPNLPKPNKVKNG